MEVAVFGANGFVGSAISKALTASGATVHPFAAPRIKSSGSTAPDLATELNQAISAQTGLIERLLGVDAIVNAAGVSDASARWSPRLVGANSLLPSLLAALAQQAGVSRVVHISSAAVLGTATLDDSRRWQPMSPYARSKALGEELLLAVSPPAVHTTIYRPPGVHASDRQVTRNLIRLACSPASSVAGEGSDPTPQALLANVADAVRFLVASVDAPEIVAHPWDGQTTSSLLTNLSGGRTPKSVPRSLASRITRAMRLLRFNPAHTRRLEVLWFGQHIARSWLENAGWNRPVDDEGWKRLSQHSTGLGESSGSRHPSILFAVTASLQVPYLGRTPQQFASAGWETHIVSDPGAELASVDQSAGRVSQHEISMARDPSPARDAKALVKWIRLLRTVSPDAVVLGTPKAALLGLLAAKFNRVPVRIYLLRGLRVETANGPLRVVLWCLERLSIWSSTEVISTSPSLTGRMDELRLAGRRPVVVLGSGSSHGVDLARFSDHGKLPDLRSSARRSMEIPESDYVVGFIGRIRADKGVPELIHAIERVGQKRPTKLVLVGRVEEPSVMELACGGLRKGEILHVPHADDIEQYIPAFDVLCLPSHREGFPNVVLEAAGLSIPSLVSDATGARDAVVQDETGRIFRTHDVDSLVTNLEILLDPVTRRRLGQGAKVRVTREFDERLINRLYLEHVTARVAGPQIDCG